MRKLMKGEEFLDCEGEEMALVEKDQNHSEVENRVQDQVPNEAADKTSKNSGNQDKKQ